MVNFIKRNLFIILLVLGILFFFQKTFTQGLLPIPSDTIVGLYHPYLDMLAKVSPAGIAFKNFLITDPVRQIIPWKELSIDMLSRFELPLWNPYEMAGKPLLANFQSGVFYPLNLLLFIKPPYLSWTVFIILQPVLAGIFLFFYLRNLKLLTQASLLGALSFALGGFSIVWLEWGNIVHTALWLPLILLSIDKIFEHSDFNSKLKTQNSKLQLKSKNLLIWSVIFLFSLVSSFFAGHLQIFFYVFVVSFAYLLFRWFEHSRKLGIIVLFTIYCLLFTVATAIQWISTLQFINLSARSLDQNPLTVEGWFIPLQHLIQFLAPDFFGNPSTLNYFGTWNYAEFVGYVGVIGLFLAFCSILSKMKKEVLFFMGTVIVSLLFALPTVIAKLPFDFSVPFISSAQPTRLIFPMAFSLSVLGAFGLDYLAADKKINIKAISIVGLLFIILYLSAWLIVLGKIDLKITDDNLLVSKRNLIFPTGIFILGMIIIAGVIFIKEKMIKNFLILAILVLSFYDLHRFGTKFTPFTNKEYFYPQTRVIEFLKKDKGIFRIASNDSRIFPPNFSTYYKIQSIEGYDPLYLKSYAELIAASERESHSIHTPFGFNRIITPRNMNSKIIDLLNVKYVLSLSDLDLTKLTKVFQEGQTRVYVNRDVLPRTFFVREVLKSHSQQETIDKMFIADLAQTAFVQDIDSDIDNLKVGKATIIDYSENSIHIKTENGGDGFLVLADAYYPTWNAAIDGMGARIYKTNYTFRGIYVPAGKHSITFYANLF